MITKISLYGRIRILNLNRPRSTTSFILIGWEACDKTKPTGSAFHGRIDRLVGLVVKTFASREADPGFESRLRRDFAGSSHASNLKNWHWSGYPARHLALQGQCWDWLARCQYIVTGWDGEFKLQLLSQCGSTYVCVSRSVSEIH